MSVVVPARLDRKLVVEIERLVGSGLYVSRSDVVRDAVRRLVESRRVTSAQAVLETVARVASAMVRREMGGGVTDVILFGSVARGEAGADSDVDLLVLVVGGVNPEQATLRLSESLYPIMLATDTVVTVTAVHKEVFVEMVGGGYSFARGVLREGVQLHGRVMDELRSRELLAQGS